MSKKTPGNAFNSFESLDPSSFLASALEEARVEKEKEKKEEEKQKVAAAEAQKASAARKNAPKKAGKSLPVADSSNKTVTPNAGKGGVPKVFNLATIDPNNPDDVALMEKYHPDTPITQKGRDTKMGEFARNLRIKYNVLKEEEEDGDDDEDEDKSRKKNKREKKAKVVANKKGVDPEDTNNIDDETDEVGEDRESEDTEVVATPTKTRAPEKGSSSVFVPFDISKARLNDAEKKIIDDNVREGKITLADLTEFLDKALDADSDSEKRRLLLGVLTAINQGVIVSKKKKDIPLPADVAAKVEVLSEKVQTKLSELEGTVQRRSRNLDDLLAKIDTGNNTDEEDISSENDATVKTNEAGNRSQLKTPEELKKEVGKKILSGKLSSEEFVSPTQALAEPGFIEFCDGISENRSWDYNEELSQGFSDNLKLAFETFVNTRKLISNLREIYVNDVEKKTNGVLQFPEDAHDCVEQYILNIATHFNPEEIKDLLSRCELYIHGPAVIEKAERALLEAKQEASGLNAQAHHDNIKARQSTLAYLKELISEETVEVVKDRKTKEEKLELAERYSKDPRIEGNSLSRVVGAVKRKWNPDGYLKDVSDELTRERNKINDVLESLEAIYVYTEKTGGTDNNEDVCKTIRRSIVNLGYLDMGYVDTNAFYDEEPSFKDQARTILDSLKNTVDGFDKSIDEIADARGRDLVKKDQDKYSDKEKIKLARSLVAAEEHFFDAKEKKAISKNPQAWIEQAISQMEQGIALSEEAVQELEHRQRNAEETSTFVRNEFAMARMRIFEGVADGAEVRNAVIKHALEKIEGKGRKASAAVLQERRETIAKIDSYIRQTDPKRKMDLALFDKDQVDEMIANIQEERVAMLTQVTNETLDKVKIGSFKFDTLRKELLKSIDGVKDSNGNIIEGSAEDTRDAIVSILRSISSELKNKADSAKVIDPRISVISSIIYELLSE